MRKYGADPKKEDVRVLSQEEAKRRVKEARLAQLAWDEDKDEEEEQEEK
jgi:hypothetical protein